MDTFQTFEEFLKNASTQIPIIAFVINLSLTALLSIILSKMYVQYGISLSNKRLFSKNFLLISLTTMLVISIVKSSLALSLGLVGALSIIRFRAAIKEPEELTYLFLAIAIGLGFGANQGVITLVAFFIIAVIVITEKKITQTIEENQNLHLTVGGHNNKKIEMNEIVELLKKHCLAVNLKRFDETNEMFEASFLVEFLDFKQLNKTKSELKKLDDSLTISFIDNKGLY